jgi:hypothetical protein
MNAFSPEQIKIVNQAAAMAEELVSNHYKMSLTEWKRPRYDFKTLADLDPDEIIDGPLAQIIRYEGKPRRAFLNSSTYDFYKICFQDHAIVKLLAQNPSIMLFSLVLYIATHELIHIVRFSKFLQNFHASPDEKQTEEKRVHEKTHEILSDIKLSGISEVFEFSRSWQIPLDSLTDSSEKYSG